MGDRISFFAKCVTCQEFWAQAVKIGPLPEPLHFYCVRCAQPWTATTDERDRVARMMKSPSQRSAHAHCAARADNDPTNIRRS